MPDKIKNKKIAILGLGMENYALVKYVLKHKIPCEIVVCDKRKKEEIGERYEELKNATGIKWKLAKDFKDELNGFDIMFRSPGWPIFCPGVQTALKNKVELSSPMKLFFEICPTKKLIGVTGTKGKGTTSSLIYEILKAGGKKAFLGGNIGVGPFDFLDELDQDSWVVLELSSFQLEDMEKSPHIAVITNFHKEHLSPADPNNPNYHKTMKDYWHAKANIFKWQTDKDKLIANIALKERIVDYNLKGEVFYFERSNLKTRLLGDHNKENIAAAEKVAELVNIEKEIVKKVVNDFKGLPNRLEFVGEKKKIKYYNDSFATTPESAITALNSFDGSVVLLAGGADKGSDFRQFGKKINKKVKYVILFRGKGSDRLKKEIIKFGFPKNNIRPAKSMPEAIKQAKMNAVPGDTVLLSPGCASFGVFKNYKERGRLFKEEVEKQ